MHSTSNHFTSETSSNGVTERSFTLDGVSGLLWSSASAPDRVPLLLMGHGGGLHKAAPALVARAKYYVENFGFAAVAIDAPGHGDRPRSTEDARWVTEMMDARTAGRPIDRIVAEFNASLAERAVPEWRATLDALATVPEIDTEHVGYSGLTLASAVGIRLAAVEPRIAAAVFGGVLADDELLAAARGIRIPLQYLLPWDDAEIPRESGFALFDAFASEEKTLHANPGGHHQVPWHETEDSARFLVRHLRPGAVA
jgi:dienelactone hydrolase